MALEDKQEEKSLSKSDVGPRGVVLPHIPSPNSPRWLGQRRQVISIPEGGLPVLFKKHDGQLYCESQDLNFQSVAQNLPGNLLELWPWAGTFAVSVETGVCNWDRSTKRLQLNAIIWCIDENTCSEEILSYFKEVLNSFSTPFLHPPQKRG